MTHSSDAPVFQWSYLHPRYIHTWVGVGLMYLLSWLPYRLQRYLGRKLGLLVMRFLKRRKKIAQRNIELCFPEMTLGQRQTLLKENFEHMGLAFFETCIAWFWPNWRLKKHITFVGFEQLAHLKAQKKGVILLAVHSFNLELAARAFGLKTLGYGVYRPNSNPVYEWFQYKGRTRNNRLIERTNMPMMVKCLRHGEFVWYAPDQDYGHHRSEWVPFFAVEKACTTTGTHFLVKASKCDLVTLTITRDREGTGYTLTLDSPIDDFPLDDKKAAAAYINTYLERSIMRAPEQYMWLHRRFKSRPEGEASLYD